PRVATRWPAPSALPEGPDDRVPVGEILLEEEDAVAAAFEVVEVTAPDVEVEPCATPLDRDLAPAGDAVPGRDQRAVRVDREVEELVGAAAERDLPLPAAGDEVDVGDRARGRQWRAARGRERGDHQQGRAERPARVPTRGAPAHRSRLCQSTWPTKKGPRLWRYWE